MSHDERNPPAQGTYWYDPRKVGVSSAMDVLRAVRRFRVADAAMRQRAQAEMRINETDLMAIRHLIACERQHRTASPKDLSEFLNISSAATAKLLSRLSASGHIRREVNPNDGRSQRLFATRSSHDEMRQALSGTHDQLMQVALKLTADQQVAVVHFLDAMSAIAIMPRPDTEPQSSRRRNEGS
ncbi:MarR family winged helix-turn-helix transcriptional regulator [Cryobacterium ruanii]|uniref:MarR family transcriptional regulator n=1 Tax=Cryobacterium ruanii TaxID=1259197 RepID=A0A4R9AMZ1_9MICO|nr:MarR family transcriptional regulator [Cryobacterium ruanii]TFD65251.1 MarR family transcriptional regulator [Cryobacterium ruanii]